MTPSMPTKASTTLGAGVTVGVPSGTPHVFTTPAPTGQPLPTNYSIAAMVDFVGTSNAEMFTMVWGAGPFNGANTVSLGVNRGPGTGDINRYFRSILMSDEANPLLAAIGTGFFLSTFIGQAQQGVGKMGGLPHILTELDGALFSSIPPGNRGGSIFIRNKDVSDHYEITQPIVYQWRFAQFTPDQSFVLPDDITALRSFNIRMSQYTEEGDSNLSAFITSKNATENSMTIVPFNTASFVNVWGGSISIPSLGYKGTIIGWSTGKIWLLEELPADVGIGQHTCAFHFPAATPTFSIDGGANYYPIRADRDLLKTFVDYNARPAIIPSNALFAVRDISVSGGENFLWSILMDNREDGPSILQMFVTNPKIQEVELEYETSKANATSRLLREADVVVP